MPLYVRDPDAARRAYATLERRLGATVARAEAAERGAAAAAEAERELVVLRQRVLDLESDLAAARDRVETLTASRADTPVAGLIGGLGIAAELGEATMPGRTLATLGATVQAFILPAGGELGLRLPDVTSGTASSLTFDLARVPGAAAPAPPVLYSVLEEKAALYESAAWERIAPAGELLAEVAQLLAGAGGWTLPLLAEAAGSIGRREAELARAAGSEELGTRASELMRFAGAVAGVAGDVPGLSARLDATTRAAAALI